MEIPDINCAKCALQLIQVATDNFQTEGYCDNPSGISSNCGGHPGYLLFSCANIAISGEQPPSTLKPIYRSLLGGTADRRIPYHRGGIVSLFACFISSFVLKCHAAGEASPWVQAANGFWELASQSSSSPSTDGPTTSAPFWKGPVFAAVIAGSSCAVILVVTTIFLVWRARRNREMAQGLLSCLMLQLLD